MLTRERIGPFCLLLTGHLRSDDLVLTLVALLQPVYFSLFFFSSLRKPFDVFHSVFGALKIIITILGRGPRLVERP